MSTIIESRGDLQDRHRQERELLAVRHARERGELRARERDENRQATSFTRWLLQQPARDDPVGDLAIDARQDPARPRSPARWRIYLESIGACNGARDALERAIAEWTASK